MDDLQLTFTANIAESYKRLSYKLWYALAEYVDNSTQAYFNNVDELSQQLQKDGRNLTVTINYQKGENLEDDYFEIIDNSYGMDEVVLARAFTTGQKPQDTSGRSKYGLGLKTASFWLGDNWSVTTTQLGVPIEFHIEVDISKISGNSIELKIERNEDIPAEHHYTRIRIWNLHRRYVGRTISKVSDYLSSIFRHDLLSGELDIIWRNNFLEWVDLDGLLYENFDRTKAKKEFDFEVDSKRVHGWAGVLERGNRGTAGFALIQSKRVITPNYRPGNIFGEQDGGRNDLINQRLTGEVFIDGFEVSHTKDAILWTGEQEGKIEEGIKNEINDLIRIALTRRVREAAGNSDVKDFEIAVESILEEIESEATADLLNTIEVPPQGALTRTNQLLLNAVVRKIEEPVEIRVGELTVKLYSDEDMSPNDPYVISDSILEKEDKNSIVIVFNPNHPHWAEIKDDNGVLVFIRHIVYDGISEWKAWHKTGAIHHDTVKFIKDNLLRIPFEVQRSKAEEELRDTGEPND